MHKKIESDLAKSIRESLQKLDLKEIETKIKGDNEFEVIMSKEIRDRDGDLVMIKGMDTKNFMKNPVLLNSHNYYGIENLIGIFTSIRKTKVDGVPALVGKGKFATKLNPLADMANDLYKNGFLKTVSIGFIAERNTTDPTLIEKSELLECSMVSVPANPEALSTMKSKGIDVDKYIEKGLIIKQDDDFKKRRDEIYKNYKSTVNMNYNEVVGWSKTICQENNQNKDNVTVTMRLLSKNKTEWDEFDMKDANVHIKYIEDNKSKANEGANIILQDGTSCGTKGQINLKDYGFDSVKAEKKSIEDRIESLESENQELQETLKEVQKTITDMKAEAKADQNNMIEAKKTIQALVKGINGALSNLKNHKV